MGIRLTRLKLIFARFRLAGPVIDFVGGGVALPANTASVEQENTDKAVAQKQKRTEFRSRP
jgi:hypothetical protein